MALDAVVKLGGSLLAGGALSGLLSVLVEAASAWRLAVVPGGGGFADSVRRACARHSPGASAAHWMAILAMDQHAHLLAGVCPAARLVATPQELAAVAGAGKLPLLAPYAWLRAEDQLPHGWHVTSDSIAAWVAGRVGARRLVLLKSIEGVSTDGVLQETVQAGSPALAGIVDEYFAEALAPGLECWVLSGRHPERLARLLEEGRAPGTRLRGR